MKNLGQTTEQDVTVLSQYTQLLLSWDKVRVTATLVRKKLKEYEKFNSRYQEWIKKPPPEQKSKDNEDMKIKERRVETCFVEVWGKFA